MGVVRLVTRFEIFLIRIYQTFRYGKPTRCRFVPRCDAYAVDALEHFGFFRANWLLIRRIARCNPLGGWGFDPIPEKPDVSKERGSSTT